MWIRRVLSSTVIMCDNSSTIKLSKNPVMHGRSKHIKVVKDGEIELVHCRTQEQVAYVMTKALKLEAFEKLRKKMGMLDLTKVK